MLNQNLTNVHSLFHGGHKIDEADYWPNKNSTKDI